MHDSASVKVSNTAKELAHDGDDQRTRDSLVGMEEGAESAFVVLHD